MQTQFPGGSLIGCAAGFLNVPKLKGSHTALKSGMVAADALYEHLIERKPYAYQKKLQESWVYKELYKVRNIRPGFKKGLWVGVINAAFETYITHGKSPWTLQNQEDDKQLKPAKKSNKITYPKPDGKITFDRLSSLYLSTPSGLMEGSYGMKTQEGESFDVEIPAFSLDSPYETAVVH